jgi:hypothetical protein
MRELTFTEIDAEMAEQLPARELMGSSWSRRSSNRASAGNSTVGLINVANGNNVQILTVNSANGNFAEAG